MDSRIKKRRKDSGVLSLPVRSHDTWMFDEDTQELLPPLRVRNFLEWFMDPEREAGATLVQWAKDNNLHIQTVRMWLKDTRFQDLLDKRCNELNVRPDRTQAVVEAMWQRAVNGDTKAAALYLQYVGKMQPKKVEVHHTVDTRKLSDEELQAELQRLALTRQVIDIGEAHAVQVTEAAQVDVVPEADDGSAVGSPHP